MRLESSLWRISILRNYLERTNGVFSPFSFSPHGKSYRGAGCPRSPGNNILSAYVMGSALTNPRTPAQNDQSSQVKNESNCMKIGNLVATSQQLHKHPLKKTALQVSEFNPWENQPALWVWSYKQPHLPPTSLIVSPFSEASPHSTEIILSLFNEKAYPTICHIKKSRDINISHKSCSDGVNKKLPSEISVKPDLTKDLKENRTHTQKQTDTQHKETHTERTDLMLIRLITTVAVSTVF